MHQIFDIYQLTLITWCFYQIIMIFKLLFKTNVLYGDFSMKKVSEKITATVSGVLLISTVIVSVPLVGILLSTGTLMTSANTVLFG